MPDSACLPGPSNSAYRPPADIWDKTSAGPADLDLSKFEPQILRLAVQECQRVAAEAIVKGHFEEAMGMQHLAELCADAARTKEINNAGRRRF
jgi:hypothetical protein